MRRLYFLVPKIVYSFPVQLLVNNIKRNHVLMLCWVILFTMVSGGIGKYLGLPYLFLDPEYLNKVNFTSFFIMGAVCAGFTTAFHITGYIADGHRFSFVGSLSKPFTKFAINNSVIPVLFLGTYIYQIIEFQIYNQYSTVESLMWYLGGLISGYIAMTLVFFVYFWFTNKDIFKFVICRIDEKIKQNVKITRASAMQKLDIARKKQVRVDNYMEFNLRVKKVEDTGFYDKATVIQVFDQNHFNLVIIETIIFAFILLLGIFKDYAPFQLPAAASAIIFLTIFVMLSGAFAYWFGNWSATTALVLFLFFNYLVGKDFFSKRYEAFGLSYAEPYVDYSVNTLQKLNSKEFIEEDRKTTLVMLENWRSKFSKNKKPKLIFLCASGGGKRAALWTFSTLQVADSLTGGRLMDQSVLITGASGGLIGGSYFRELKLREKQGVNIHPYAPYHRQRISSDNLNPLIFSLLANDLFVGFSQFKYAGNYYEKDRSYTFEEQLDQISEHLMDKPMSAYDSMEMTGTIPMVILTPTIINDGRKMYIASRSVSFMNSEILNFTNYSYSKISGVDFMRLFENAGAKNMRFLSALRMSATFPYITPNTTLPTNPSIQIMDAGISDNFGLSDASRFLFSFKDWIAENTSGVIFISIRDSPKMAVIPPKTSQTLLDDITQPISSVYNNFENFQDINSDLVLGYAKYWFKGTIDRVDIEYQSENYSPILQGMDSIRNNNARASLSWRLTEREKESIVNNIQSSRNQRALNKIKYLLDK